MSDLQNIKNKKILSIDGGGIKGVFPASFLATLEDSIGDKISNYFDLIVGTSTGGIIALGLGLGFSAKEILSFYEELGPSVFRGSGFLNSIRRLGFAKYDSQPLKKALENEFGDRLLGESTKRLVIPSFNLETGEVYFYKTSHHPKFERDYKERVVDVALATAAAPTYFPTYRSAAGIPLIDGGIFANNPVGQAVVEAIGILQWSADSLNVLSLGCTTESFNAGRARYNGPGLLFWGPKITELFMVSQSALSLGTAQVLVATDRVIRVNPQVPQKRFGLDVIKEINSLKGLGASEARKALPRLRSIFFSEEVEKFVPYRV